MESLLKEGHYGRVVKARDSNHVISLTVSVRRFKSCWCRFFFAIMSIRIFYFPRLWAYHDLFQEMQQVFSLYINVFTNIFDRDAWSVPYVILAIILLLILAAGFLRKFMACSPKETSSHARTALQALQTVLVPTCSLWPTRYIQLVKRASSHSGHRSGSKLVVPLSMLLQDVCDGVIELRDPISDLEDLMDSGISAYGCYVCLSIDWKWWVEWLDRMVRVYVLGFLQTAR